GGRAGGGREGEEATRMAEKGGAVAHESRGAPPFGNFRESRPKIVRPAGVDDQQLHSDHEHADAPHPLGLLPARRDRPRRRAAEYGQQFPPSDGHCHTPLPREGAVKGTVSRHERAVFTLKEGWTAALAAQQEDERLSPLSPLASSVQDITE